MKTKAYNPFRRANMSAMDHEPDEWIPSRGHDRYLYHLTLVRKFMDDEENLHALRMNYAMEGLWGVGQGTNGVWANNGLSNLHSLWPVWIDSWEVCGSADYLRLFGEYDIWRIDTSLIDNKWYQDPNLFDLFTDKNRRMSYLYSDQGVHPRALSLYRLYIDPFQYIYVDPNTSRYSLVPVRSINDFIHGKWRKPMKKRVRIREGRRLRG